MSWSYSALVKEHGEERALELLSEKTDYGEFRHHMGGPQGQALDGVNAKGRGIIDDHCFCGQAWGSRRPCGAA